MGGTCPSGLPPRSALLGSQVCCALASGPWHALPITKRQFLPRVRGEPDHLQTIRARPPTLLLVLKGDPQFVSMPI